MLVIFAPRLSNATGVDSEHLFGFSSGSDIGDKGDLEGESESFGRFGKRDGRYAALAQSFEAKYTVLDDLRISAAGRFSYFGISGVRGLADRSEAALLGASIEAKYRILDRHRLPIGLTLGFEPRWTRIDDISGAMSDRHSAPVSLFIDREMAGGSILGAFNLLYEPSRADLGVGRGWEWQSSAGTSAALAFRTLESLYLGGEVRTVRNYDGLGLNRLTGAALFAGPTLYAILNDAAWLSFGWNIQMLGHAKNEPRQLDLAGFERHQAKLRIGIGF